MRTNRRGTALVMLAAAVTAAHLMLADSVLPSTLGAGAATGAPKAFDISFVRELMPSAPPAAPPMATQRPRAVAAAPVALPASAPEATPVPPPPESLTELVTPIAPVVAAAPEPESTATPAAIESGAVAEAASTAPAGTAASNFEWPPSTRLQYHLTGDFRGPVEGQASVEWRRQASRYQVDLNLSIGPAFAPLMSRSITSEGDITPDGLRPTRYDEITRMLLRDTRRLVVQMGEEQIVLAGGRMLPRPPGLQDSASQFVQLTWLFTTDPSRLRQGQLIELPLALPRRLGLWVYEVGATEQIDTPAGPVAAVHVKPRRDALAQPRAGSELSAEVWFAPSLQYLPVRMLIRQDAETFVELRLASLPQQAAEPAPSSASSPASATSR